MLLEIIWMSKYSLKSLLSQRKKWQKEWGNWQRFWRSYCEYKALASKDNQPSLQYLYPCLGDDLAETLIEPIYFYQDCWAFEKIVELAPKHHVDIGSHHKYVALPSKVVHVTMVDIRPLSLPLDSLKFKRGSILNLPFDDNSIESISSLCVIEHIGLGRYGDPLDPNGSEKAIQEIKRVLKRGANLYFSVPIEDNNKTYFNAHRSFSEEYLEQLLNPCKIVDKSYIYGKNLQKQKSPSDFGIGLYHVQK